MQTMYDMNTLIKIHKAEGLVILVNSTDINAGLKFADDVVSNVQSSYFTKPQYDLNDLSLKIHFY